MRPMTFVFELFQVNRTTTDWWDWPEFLHTHLTNAIEYVVVELFCVSKSSVDWRNNFLMLWDSHTRNKTMHLENIPFINRMGISVSVVDDMSRWEKQTKIRMHYRRVREEWWISFFHWGGEPKSVWTIPTNHDIFSLSSPVCFISFSSSPSKGRDLVSLNFLFKKKYLLNRCLGLWTSRPTV